MSAGDHLQVPRQHGLFNHHGIDLGDGTVAHYLEGRMILRSSIEEFCRGKDVSVVNHKDASSNRLTLQRAISRIGEQKYNLLFNNCEHFANWCKTGQHRSNQLEEWLQKSSLSAIAIGQGIPAALFTSLNLLLKQGLADPASRENAKKMISKMEHLKRQLIKRLDVTLKEIDTWIDLETKPNKSRQKTQEKENLLLQGQTLANQLNRIENVQTQITNLLNK